VFLVASAAVSEFILQMACKGRREVIIFMINGSIYAASLNAFRKLA
jgi:hypothetical protein